MQVQRWLLANCHGLSGGSWAGPPRPSDAEVETFRNTFSSLCWWLSVIDTDDRLGMELDHTFYSEPS